MPRDNQRTELLGRHILINQLMTAGIEVSIPVRDRGVDVIAYLDLAETNTSFIARPIQLKASTNKSFVVDSAYLKISNLIMAYVWHVTDPSQAVVFACTVHDTIAIAKRMKWDKNPSWSKFNGFWTTTSPSKQLIEILSDYQMTPEKWNQLIHQ